VPAALAERAHLIYLKTCRSLGKDDEASAALEASVSSFRRAPPSRSRAVLTVPPGTIYPAPPPSPPSDAAPAEADVDAPESKTLTIAACAGQIVTDPLFVFLWLAVTFVLSAFACTCPFRSLFFFPPSPSPPSYGSTGPMHGD